MKHLYLIRDTHTGQSRGRIMALNPQEALEVWWHYSRPDKTDTGALSTWDAFYVLSAQLHG